MAHNPFSKSDTRAGHGEIHLSLLPPSLPSFRTLCYTYPLKLVSSTPHPLSAQEAHSEEATDARRPQEVPLIFLLSYGGGLLPPDVLALKITLDPHTRLTITTQGSTKIFPSPPHTSACCSSQSCASPHVARQDLDVKLGAGSALLLTPDPSQPFRNSNYSQSQIFEVSEGSSLCLLDWVTSGRPARNEVWDAASWKGKNEIWQAAVRQQDGTNSRRRLVLRDNVLLVDGSLGRGQSSLKAEGLGAFGTLILLGPVFERLGNFFVDEYAAIPRIGGRDWGDKDAKGNRQPGTGVDDGSREAIVQDRLSWRQNRLKREAVDGVIWTAARVRGLLLIKFAASDVEGLRGWLASICRKEGTIANEFGPGGMLSLA